MYPIRIPNHRAPNHQLIPDSVINSPTIPDKKQQPFYWKNLNGWKWLKKPQCSVLTSNILLLPVNFSTPPLKRDHFKRKHVFHEKNTNLSLQTPPASPLLVRLDDKNPEAGESNRRRDVSRWPDRDISLTVGNIRPGYITNGWSITLQCVYRRSVYIPKMEHLQFPRDYCFNGLFGLTGETYIPFETVPLKRGLFMNFRDGIFIEKRSKPFWHSIKSWLVKNGILFSWLMK